MNPQGPDWMKALLMFSEGKPLADLSLAMTVYLTRVDEELFERKTA